MNKKTLIFIVIFIVGIALGVLLTYLGRVYYKESVERKELLGLITGIREKIEKERVNMTLYIKIGTAEEEVLFLKEQINTLEEVLSVDYVSQEQALVIFKQKNQGNSDIIEAIDNLGENIFNPIFVIWPKKIDDLDKISSYLDGIDSEIVDHYNFVDHRPVLKKIDAFEKEVKNNFKKVKAGYEKDGKYFLFFDNGAEEKSLDDLFEEMADEPSSL